MQLETYEKRERNQVSDSTVDSRMYALKEFQKFIGQGTEPEVEDVEEWVDHMIDKHENGELKASTIKQYFRAVTYYFDKIKGQPDALDHISRYLPESDVDHGEYLTEEEWQEMINRVYKLRDRAFLEIMYQYARRPTEVRLLNLEDIDMEEGTIKFNILKKKKDDRGRRLPLLQLKRDGEVYEEHRVFGATFELHENVIPHLERYLEHKEERTEQVIYDGEEMTVHPLFSANYARMTYGTVRRMVKEHAEKAGIEKNITPKSKRHSRVTHLDWGGVEPEIIARQQLIHDPDSNVVGSYIHSRDEDDVREVLDTDDESE